MTWVSVPLPGFSGLRLPGALAEIKAFLSFSPVAGIQWVETSGTGGSLLIYPVVSVPLPGFSGLRLFTKQKRESYP